MTGGEKVRARRERQPPRRPPQGLGQRCPTAAGRGESGSPRTEGFLVVGWNMADHVLACVLQYFSPFGHTPPSQAASHSGKPRTVKAIEMTHAATFN